MTGAGVDTDNESLIGAGVDINCNDGNAMSRYRH